MFVGCGYTSKGRGDFNNHLQKHEGDKERPLTDMLTSEVIFIIVKSVLFVRTDLQEFKT